MAVKEDSFSKTHPVKDSVLTSYQSIELLDAVTFFKSANIIRNLYSVAGPELFLKGLRNMLIKYSGKNINYEQFIEIYSGLAKERDMLENPSDLLSSFILNHGINELNVNFELEEEKDLVGLQWDKPLHRARDHSDEQRHRLCSAPNNTDDRIRTLHTIHPDNPPHNHSSLPPLSQKRDRLDEGHAIVVHHTGSDESASNRAYIDPDRPQSAD